MRLLRCRILQNLLSVCPSAMNSRVHKSCLFSTWTAQGRQGLAVSAPARGSRCRPFHAAASEPCSWFGNSMSPDLTRGVQVYRVVTGRHRGLSARPRRPNDIVDGQRRGTAFLSNDRSSQGPHRHCRRPLSAAQTVSERNDPPTLAYLRGQVFRFIKNSSGIRRDATRS